MITVTLQPTRFAIGRSAEAVLRLHNTSTRPCITVVFEFELPAGVLIKRGLRDIVLDRIDPDGHRDIEVTLLPKQLGRHRIVVVNFSFRDGDGMVHRIIDRTIDLEVHPAPDEPAPPVRPRRTPIRRTVFVSYRRADSPWFVDLLVDRIEAAFPGRVFVDLRAIRPGEDFRARIDEELRRCAALLVLIGPRWLAAATPDGKPRLHREGDLVCHEVTTALERGMFTLPVLFDGAGMPRAEDLPDDMRRLADLNAKPVDRSHFESDVRDIIEQLREKLT